MILSLFLTLLSAVPAAQTTAPSAARTVVSKDGTRIAYDVAGSGPVVILLHGGGHTRQVWHEAGYVERLSKEFTVVAIDMRGNGESGRPTEPSHYAIDRHVDDILAVADAVSAPRFALWGFSYGANIGRYVAARSDRVRSMVYIGIPFGPAADARFKAAIEDLKTKRPPQEIAWLTALLDYPAVEPADMRCPTLWLVGTENAGAMASVKAYEQKLAGTRVTLELLKGLNHPQELGRIDETLPRAVAFTRAHR